LIGLTLPDSWGQRDDFASGGLPVGSFLDQTKRAQPRGFGRFGLLLVFAGWANFHVYVFYHVDILWLGHRVVRRAVPFMPAIKSMIGRVCVCAGPDRSSASQEKRRKGPGSIWGFAANLREIFPPAAARRVPPSNEWRRNGYQAGTTV
jgi:hypothetical protein